MSVNDVTLRAAVVAGLAMLALLLAGWRKTARATPKTSRGDAAHPRQVPIAVVRQPAPAHVPPTPLRRLWAIIASSGISLVIAAVIATTVAVGIALVVTRMTDLLRQ